MRLLKTLKYSIYLKENVFILSYLLTRYLILHFFNKMYGILIYNNLVLVSLH